MPRNCYTNLIKISMDNDKYKAYNETKGSGLEELIVLGFEILWVFMKPSYRFHSSRKARFAKG